MIENRYLLNYTMEDLEEKMVFIRPGIVFTRPLRADAQAFGTGTQSLCAVCGCMEELCLLRI